MITTHHPPRGCVVGDYLAPEPSINIHRWAVAVADASAIVGTIYGVEGTTLGLVALAMAGRRSAPTVHLTDE